MNKFLIASIVLLFLIVISVGGYLGYTYVNQSKARAIQTTAPPPTFQNPFATKPASSFRSSRGQFQNPFAVTPTPTTYQNPFASTQSGSQPYQNPFGPLR